VVADFPDITVKGFFKLFIFYLDDDYVVGKHTVLIRLGELLAHHGILLDELPSPDISSSQDSASTTQVLVDTLACSVPRYLYNLAHDSGAHLNTAKSPAWWHTAPSADKLQKYEDSGVSFLWTEGVLVLNVPVGSDTYGRTQLVNKVEELRTRMQVLGDFQDTQAALFILRVSMGVCRVNFLLRALPQPLVKDVANVFDALMQENFASISCVVLPDRVWTAAQLPISTPDCPGLGLTTLRISCLPRIWHLLTPPEVFCPSFYPQAFSRPLSLPLMSSQSSTTSALVETPLHPRLVNFAARCVTSRSPYMAMCTRRWRRGSNNYALRRSCFAYRRCL
jgi:hypothetical protein